MEIFLFTRVVIAEISFGSRTILADCVLHLPRCNGADFILVGGNVISGE